MSASVSTSYIPSKDNISNETEAYMAKQGTEFDKQLESQLGDGQHYKKEEAQHSEENRSIVESNLASGKISKEEGNKEINQINKAEAHYLETNGGVNKIETKQQFEEISGQQNHATVSFVGDGL